MPAAFLEQVFLSQNEPILYSTYLVRVPFLTGTAVLRKSQDCPTTFYGKINYALPLFETFRHPCF